jgi:hypothetical protein
LVWSPGTGYPPLPPLPFSPLTARAHCSLGN